MQIPVVNMTMNIHLMKKIEVGLLEIICMIKKYHMKVKISSFSDNLKGEESFDWLAKFDQLYEYTRILYSRIVIKKCRV